MKISVVIIAHNEEEYVEKCIASVLNQSRRADEIILVAHNCTDKTITIAKQYPITIVPYNGPQGITYARIHALEYTQGDIICCIDGDGYAKENWIEVLSSLLTNGNILVGSWVRFRGTFFGWVSNIFNYFFCVNKRKAEQWIWGGSMAFWEKDKQFVKEVFEKSIILQKDLSLSRVCDDFWLALFMKQKGSLAVTNKTHSSHHEKHTTFTESVKRNRENLANGTRIKDYFSSKSNEHELIQ